MRRFIINSPINEGRDDPLCTRRLPAELPPAAVRARFWALVGDAGLHKDPILALGICDALRDVEFLADAIADGLSGRAIMAAALADYERRRNEASATDYADNIAAARFTPLPAQALAIRAAVRHRPEDATRLWKARARMIDPAQFFNSQNLERLLGGLSMPAV